MAALSAGYLDRHRDAFKLPSGAGLTAQRNQGPRSALREGRVDTWFGAKIRRNQDEDANHASFECGGFGANCGAPKANVMKAGPHKGAFDFFARRLSTDPTKMSSHAGLLLVLETKKVLSCWLVGKPYSSRDLNKY
jgi:hypothetical protein